jgi:hypothetical protein
MSVPVGIPGIPVISLPDGIPGIPGIPDISLPDGIPGILPMSLPPGIPPMSPPGPPGIPPDAPIVGIAIDLACMYFIFHLASSLMLGIASMAPSAASFIPFLIIFLISLAVSSSISWNPRTSRICVLTSGILPGLI